MCPARPRLTPDTFALPISATATIRLSLTDDLLERPYPYTLRPQRSFDRSVNFPNYLPHSSLQATALFRSTCRHGSVLHRWTLPADLTILSSSNPNRLRIVSM